MRAAGTRSALFRFDEVKVVSGALAVADSQRVADRLGDVGLGGLHGLAQRLAEREVRGDRRGVRAAAPVGVRRVDVLALEDLEELPVVKQVGPTISQQMPALDEHVATPHLVNDLRGLACVGEGLDLDAGELLRDRKSTRLNSSHGYISYAVFCLKKKSAIA